MRLKKKKKKGNNNRGSDDSSSNMKKGSDNNNNGGVDCQMIELHPWEMREVHTTYAERESSH